MMKLTLFQCLFGYDWVDNEFVLKFCQIKYTSSIISNASL